jgi:prepilin-type N-terminal cleavage/methylation domain-containing protein
MNNRLHISLQPLRSKGLQKGFTLLELLVVVSVSALFYSGLAMSARYENRKLIGQRIGTSYKPISQALQDYVQANKQTLVQGLPVTGVVNPMAPTINELRALNLYSVNYPLTIQSNGGTPIFRINRIPTGCAPAACDLEYFAGNSSPDLSADGTADEGVLSTAALTIGATAGYSKSVTPSVITGQGGWTFPNPNGAVGGIFGIYTTYSQSGNNAYVRIGDNRDPNLQGALTTVGAISTSSDATAAGKVQGATLKSTGDLTVGGDANVTGTAKSAKVALTDTVVEGAGCGVVNGLVSKDATGLLLSCQSGSWKKQYTFDAATSQSYTWNQIIGSGWGSGTPTSYFVSIPFGTDANTRFVSMSAVVQWASSAAAVAGLNIVANGQLCSGSSDNVGNGGSGYRTATTCVFKIVPNANPNVYLQFIGISSAYINIDTPSNIAVSFFTLK